MSRYTRYERTECLEVTDYNKLQRFIKMNELGLINGDNMSHLFNVHHRANPKENKLDWYIVIGLNECDEYSDFVLNHFAPTDCTVQIFFSEIAKFTAPFKIYAFDEEFPQIHDGDGNVYAWELDNNEEGILTITELQLIKSDKSITDMSTLDEDDYNEFEEQIKDELQQV